MGIVRDRVLREWGDEGAEAVARYWTQIEYIAYWCIRMIRPEEGIEAIVPEFLDDVVVRRRTHDELHQVKTRNESQGPWLIDPILPIICKQWSRRAEFRENCRFFFASNQIADNRRRQGPASRASLYRLKHLLQIVQQDEPLQPEEQTELDAVLRSLTGSVQTCMRDKHGETLDEETIRSLLLRTHIETESRLVHHPYDDEDECSHFALCELAETLDHEYPLGQARGLYEAKRVYERLLLLIVHKIRTKGKADERRITPHEVADCRVAPMPIAGQPLDLDNVPGETVLDKKAYLGGFTDPRRLAMRKEVALAECTKREVAATGDGQRLDRLTAALLDEQITCWETLKVSPVDDIGPRALAALRSRFPAITEKYFPSDSRVDTLFCQGLLWIETGLCRARWDRC